jgi:hypothetical protein
MLYCRKPLAPQRQHRCITQAEHCQPARQQEDTAFHQNRPQRRASLVGGATACLRCINVLWAYQEQRKEARQRHAGEYPKRRNTTGAAREPGDQQRRKDIASMIPSLVTTLPSRKLLLTDNTKC